MRISQELKESKHRRAGFASLCGIQPVDAHEFSRERCLGKDGGVYAFGLTREIRIICAGDDAAVVGLLAMQAEKVLAVQGEHGPASKRGVFENLGIRHGLANPAGFLDGYNSVSKLPKKIGDGAGKVLVRVVIGHL
jgi:hypothetical protein